MTTYDSWKAAEPDDGAEEPGETELELLYAREARLRASRDALLAAAKDTVSAITRGWRLGQNGQVCIRLKAAIAKAEELAP